MKKTYLNIEVNNRESFSDFLKLLLEDYKIRSKEWENNRLDLFLEAMQVYSKGIEGYYKNTAPEIDADIPSWKIFADILRGAVVYE
jgi:hypothetical protein